jgi:hypothetical protein
MIGSDDMKKILLGIILSIMVFGLIACAQTEEPTETDSENYDIFRLLIEAEDLSGMSNQTKTVIRTPGSLNLPTEYQGVQILYSSRNKDIIDDNGVVTQPNECWIESRDQQGIAKEEFENLNDNWPIVIDVTMTYQGQVRTAKLLFVVAPAEGYTCNKYLG